MNKSALAKIIKWHARSETQSESAKSFSTAAKQKQTKMVNPDDDETSCGRSAVQKVMFIALTDKSAAHRHAP